MEIVIPKGIFIGHADNENTGVTVILAPRGAVCGVDVRGGAPGTRETDLLRSEKTVGAVNAVVLSGGSAYGLESCCGVMNYLRERGSGFAIGDKVVPIVCGAVIYDLNGEEYSYPDIRMGYDACLAASRHDVAWGRVGCGKGATVGKLMGMEYAEPGGIGAATVSLGGGAFVTAVIAVNACGDIYSNGRIIAGARTPTGEFADMRSRLLNGFAPVSATGRNTTIGCVIVNAKAAKHEANKLASVAHDGLARSISPVHTDFDGDTIFAMATGEVETDINLLGVAAVEAVERAVAAAVGYAGN